MTLTKVKKNIPAFKRLVRANPTEAKQIIRKGKKDFIDSISECSLNVLNGNVEISPERKRKLQRYKKQIRFISKKQSSLKKRKDVLQKGGFLNILVPVLGAITKLLS